MVKHNAAALAAAVILFFGLSSALFSADGEPTAVTIRYYDKRVYYLESDPILVQVTLTNNGPSAYRFKLADERAFSVDFDVKTTTNRPVEAADPVVRRRSTSRQVYFREISIEAGESFSFVENLKDYAVLDKSGAYVVQAHLYPELFYPEPGIARPAAAAAALVAGRPIESNRLALTIRPSRIPGPDGAPLPLDVETNAVLVREKLAPDEIVRYLLTARQKEQWEKFFLYLDLESMLTRNAQRRRQWQAESEEGRAQMLARYRRELQSATVDGDIATIPMNFTIERTQYGAEEGTVTALEYFRVGSYTERKRYTYYLRRRDELWSIEDYTVVNLGTE
jgi:hypothetical protein